MVLIPEDMDVPLNRRDTSKPENVRWLVRNLPIRNSNILASMMCGEY